MLLYLVNYLFLVFTFIIAPATSKQMFDCGLLAPHQVVESSLKIKERDYAEQAI